MKDICCTACGYYGIIDRAHIKTRGSGAKWEEHEWMPLCRGCHGIQSRLGWSLFVKRFPHIAKVLDEKGWEIKNQFGRNKLMRKE